MEILPEGEIFERINGCSYQENDNIPLEELRYVQVLYYGFDGETHMGELIVNREIAEDVLEIFQELYEAQYPIERMELVDNYGGDDEASMAANNTSAFNYRTISGTSRLSNHSYGKAIDLNPFYNPYVYTSKDGQLHCEPAEAVEYEDRSKDFPHKIDHRLRPVPAQQGRRGVRLGVAADLHHPQALFRQCSGDVADGGGLADAALPVNRKLNHAFHTSP